MNTTKLKKLAAITITIFIIIVFLFIISPVSFGDNSDGDRVGQVIKISKKGWVWKTYEGELTMGSFQGSSGLSPYVFEFTVCDKDQNKINIIENSLGKQVKITYTSPLIYFKWKQDSKYCVDKVEVLQ